MLLTMVRMFFVCELGNCHSLAIICMIDSLVRNSKTSQMGKLNEANGHD